MTAFNFADKYKTAGLAPGPEIIQLRQVSFDKLKKNATEEQVLELTRMLFGLPVLSEIDWFREAFAKDDPSFSLVDNDREAAVLAGCLLEGMRADGGVLGDLAVLATAIAGQREPSVFPDFVEQAQEALSSASVRERAHPVRRSKPTKKTSIASGAGAVVEALKATPDWNTVTAAIEQVDATSVERASALSRATRGPLAELGNHVDFLREEVDMLWWHVGGWSRILQKPFEDMEPALSAVLAGLDLADLSRTPAGPVAAPALLQRTMAKGDAAEATISITEAVDQMAPKTLELLALGEGLQWVPDICPVLTAFRKSAEIGKSPSWHEAFEKAAHVSPDLRFTPLRLAMQVYRERSLVTAIS